MGERAYLQVDKRKTENFINKNQFWLWFCKLKIMVSNYEKVGKWNMKDLLAISLKTCNEKKNVERKNDKS